MGRTLRHWPVLLAAGALAVASPPACHRAVAGPMLLVKDKPGDNLTLTGIVTRDLPGNEFKFRSDDGRDFRVIALGVKENGLANGDRVEVRGKRDTRDTGVINADVVTKIKGPVNTGQGETMTLDGVVSRDLPGNEFNFRSDDGRVFRVIALGVKENGLANGDRVQVRGRRDAKERDVINAETVTKIGAAGQGESLTLRGQVTRDLAGNQFNFRSDDGRDFRIVLLNKQENGVTKGDRVEVRGQRDTLERDVINASSVTNTGIVPGGGQGGVLTLTGVVTRDLAGNQFNFQSDDGRDFRVVALGVGENGVSNGDRVEVRGRRDVAERDVLNATVVTRIGGLGEILTLTGVVARDLDGNQFNFRADDGRVFRIALRGTQPRWLSNGDRVEVRGKRDIVERDVIIADSVTAITNVNGLGNSVSQYGIVTRNLPGDTFEMRTGDGTRLILVTARNGEPRGLNVGDEVRVEGIAGTRRGEITTMMAETVEPVEKYNPYGAGGPANGSIGQRADLSGVALRVDSRTQLDMRADNGRVYNITSDDKFSANIKAGDRVRVVGIWNGVTAVRADKVVLETPVSTVGTDGTVNFWGQVQSVNSNGLIRDLQVRGDSGWLYNVQYRNLQTFRVGDRVHVIGTLANGGVTATSVSTR